MSRTLFFMASSAALVLALAGPGAAQKKQSQPDPSSKPGKPTKPTKSTGDAAAEAMFQEGVALRKAGKWRDACKKFAASQKLAPARGTLLNLAECHERYGDIASAWSAYKKLADQAQAANDTERINIAKRKIRELEPRLPRVVLRLAPGARVPHLSIALDGLPIDASVTGVSIPVDSGPHMIEASAPNRVRWSRRVTLAERQSLEITIPVLAMHATATPAPTPVATPPDRLVPPATVSKPAAPPSRPVILTAGVGLGSLDFGEGLAAPGMAPMLVVGGAYRLWRGAVALELGGRLRRTSIDWASGGASGSMSMTSMVGEVGVAYRWRPRVVLRALIGGGLEALGGLDAGNPFTVANAPTAGALLRPHVGAAAGVDILFGSSFVLRVAPRITSTAVPDGFRGDIDRITNTSLTVSAAMRL